MGISRVLATVMLFTMVGTAGCIESIDTYYEFDPDQQYRNPGVFPGEYREGAGGSQVLNVALAKSGLPDIVRLVSDRPAYPGEAGEQSTDAQVLISIGVWKPRNYTGQLPIIVDAGPYFEQGDHCKIEGQVPCQEPVPDTIDWPGQRTPWMLDNMLPHGYAIAQVGVRGTGSSGGCMDLMGEDEVADLDQAITWLGNQPWSNGNIAMIGASYDGSTPWLVAGTGNPHLKTIVPVSGLPDIYDLMFHNGTAETRGALMHNQVYWGYGISDEFPVPVGSANGRERYQDLQHLACPDVIEGSAIAAASVATGDRHDDVSGYWVERNHKQAVLDNYEGSVFLIHGLQDWNVDPHAAIPFNAELRAKGLEMKEWYGQWGHAYPDSTCAKAAPPWVTLPCRYDFAEVLLRWFDRHLKGDMDVDVGHHTQLQDQLGYWRNAHSYPAEDATWESLYLDGETLSDTPGTQEEAHLLRPSPRPTIDPNGGPSNFVELTSEPMPEDTHISGLIQVKVPFEVAGEGGEIGAWLLEMDPRGLVRAPGTACIPPAPDRLDCTWTPVGLPIVGRAQMNLRFYAGGEEAQVLQPATRYIAQVEMDAAELHIPAGHRLVLWLFQYGAPDHQSSGPQAAVTIYTGGDDAKMRLPVVDLDLRTVFPVPGAHFQSDVYVPEMYVPLPNFQRPVPVKASPAPIQIEAIDAST